MVCLLKIGGGNNRKLFGILIMSDAAEGGSDVVPTGRSAASMFASIVGRCVGRM